VIKTRVDSQKRIVLSRAIPGQVYAVHDNPDGGFTLKVVETEGSILPTCRLADEDGFQSLCQTNPSTNKRLRNFWLSSHEASAGR
jgi:hypothetical protein